MLTAGGTITQVTHKFSPAQVTLGFFVVNRDGTSVAFPSDEDFVGHNADASVEIFVWNANADVEQITDTEGNHNVVVLGIVDTSSSVTFLSDADFSPLPVGFLADCRG